MVSGVSGAVQGLRALALMDENVGIRKQHMKWLQQQWFGGTVNYSAFNKGSDGLLYEVNASTSNDAYFKAQLAIYMNIVAERVRDEFSRIDEEFVGQFHVESNEGEMKHCMLFKGGRVFMASWRDIAIPKLNLDGGGPLLITHMMRPLLQDVDVDTGMVSRRMYGAEDEMLDAFRAIAVSDMLEKVRGRPDGVSVRQGIRALLNQSNYAGHTFIYNSSSRKWKAPFNYSQMGVWSDADLKELASRLEDVKEELKESDLESLGGRDDQLFEMLPKMKRLAERAEEIERTYDFAGGVTDLAADVEDVEDVVSGDKGADKCYGVPGGWCGGQTALVGGGGIFGEMIRAKMDELIGRVDAAMAADSSLPAEEIKKLQSELSDILGALRSHVGGSLQQIRGELLMARQAVQPTDAVMEDSHRTLSDIASSLGVLAGLGDALKLEEEYVAEREIKYSVIHQTYEADGRAEITMVRVKENNKLSVYVAWLA
jgi:ElaB/YqjD/DUF883 family membrane-anchored ribosome-binding protein